jgi:hypothetical protein
LDIREALTQMGMGVSWYICAGPSLNAGTFSICQAFPCAISSRWNLDISSAMPIPAEHPMVFAIEWDDHFGANRYSGTAVPNEV